MSDPHAAAREALTARLATLIGREDALSKHLRGEDGRRGQDFGDVASFTQGDEVIEGLEDAALGEIAEIRGALRRIDDGAYGTCEGCGGEISPQRLQVLPHARLCVSCAAKDG